MDKGKPHSPIIFFDESKDQELLSMTKSPEDRLYIVMYYNDNTESYEYNMYIGRTNCYFGIQSICENSEIDPKDMTVLVEYIVKNRKTNNYEYALMHPDNSEAKNAFQFCKSVEDLFGDNAFDITKYTDAREDELDDISGTDVTPIDLLAHNMVDVNAFEGSLEMANMYADIMREKNESNYDPKSLFQAPAVNPFDKKD